MKRAMLALIRFYQRQISPWFPRRCRFSPTCSQYALEAISRYGAMRGDAFLLLDASVSDFFLYPLQQFQQPD